MGWGRGGGGGGGGGGGSTLISSLISCSLTPITNIGASADGAEMTTRRAPPWRCADAFSSVVKTPVDSTTYSAPYSFHGMFEGS